MSLFNVDLSLCKVARDMDLTLDRYERVEITDANLLEAAGLTRTVPDYLRIRKLLLDGVEVPGARLAGTEYILRRKEQS